MEAIGLKPGDKFWFDGQQYTVLDLPEPTPEQKAEAKRIVHKMMRAVGIEPMIP